MASKRIVILDQDPTGFNYILWADVPVTRQSFYANAAAASAWKDAAPADLSALQAGSVVEHADRYEYHGETIVQLEAALQAIWLAYQTTITARNPWSRYGSFWAGDGSAWTGAGVN